MPDCLPANMPGRAVAINGGSLEFLDDLGEKREHQTITGHGTDDTRKREHCTKQAVREITAYKIKLMESLKKYEMLKGFSASSQLILVVSRGKFLSFQALVFVIPVII